MKTFCFNQILQVLSGLKQRNLKAEKLVYECSPLFCCNDYLAFNEVETIEDFYKQAIAILPLKSTKFVEILQKDGFYIAQTRLYIKRGSLVALHDFYNENEKQISCGAATTGLLLQFVWLLISDISKARLGNTIFRFVDCNIDGDFTGGTAKPRQIFTPLNKKDIDDCRINSFLFEQCLNILNGQHFQTANPVYKNTIKARIKSNSLSPFVISWLKSLGGKNAKIREILN